MSRSLWFIAIAITAGVSMPARAIQDAPLPEAPQRSAEAVAVDDSSDLWFIELTGAPTAEGGFAGAVRQEQQNFRKAAAAAGVRYTERRAFEALFNGFSAAVAPADLPAIARLPQVRAMYPVARVSRPRSRRCRRCPICRLRCR